IPKNEIQFIHEANSESKKQKLFEKVRSGEVRILMGSTAKMGAGTNVQDKLIALHDIDCPWRPSDLEQRLGRIVRQGNTNEKVDIYRYVTEQTFDAYLYQLVENKQKFSSQIMTSKSPVRTAEDIDETALSYAEIKMLATGNPYIKEKMDLDIQVAKLRVLKQNYLAEHFNLEDKILKYFPKRISELESVIKGLEVDNQIQQNNPKAVADEWQGIQINNKNYFEKAKAGEALLEVCKQFKSDNPQEIGSYRGFKLLLSFDSFEKVFEVSVKGNISRTVTLGIDEIGNITRLDNAIDNIPEKLKSTKANLENTLNQLENAKVEMTKPFAKEDELKQKTKRLNKLNAVLNVDQSTNNNQNQSLELDDEELELGI
ncbi:MAG: helicase-related protein, partial [Acutalibacteraceae bacterium]